MNNPMDIKNMLEYSKVIAVVGLSDKPDRDSYHVAAYLQQQGYKIIPVNPNAVEILGEKSYSDLTAIKEPVDIVDIFRKPEAVGEIVDQAIQMKAKAVWMQEGVVNEDAAQKASQAGLKVVMNKCILKEHRRLVAYG